MFLRLSLQFCTFAAEIKTNAKNYAINNYQF